MFRNPFKTLRIDYLLFGAFAGLIVLLLFMITWLSYNLTVKELAGNTSFYQQKLLNELNKQVSIQMNTVERMALAISTNVDLVAFLSLKDDFYERQRTQKEIEKYLSNEVYSMEIMDSIELYMENPALPISQTGVVSVSRFSALQDQAWFPMIANSDFSWVGEREIVTAFNGTQQVISFARKIYTNTGKYQGLLIMNVIAEPIKRIMRGEETDGVRILLDMGKRVIISTRSPAEGPDWETQLMQTSIGKYDVHALRDSIGDSKGEFIVAVSDVPSSDWTLIELTPWRTITKGSFRIAAISIFIGVSFILISIFFTLFLSKQFIRPITLLLKAMSMSSIDTGKINLPSDYNNEFGVLFTAYRKFVERIEQLYASLEDKYLRQREVEIQALQAMINPHFLYNTLDQINWMAIEANQSKISKVLELTGNMFRIGLSNGEPVITIEDELEHVRCYLEIQQMRWEEGLYYKFDVPDPIKKLYIPKLILQPFVENAVIHGLNDRDRGCIEIRIREEYGQLLITIRDDGVGLKSDWNVARNRKTGGYGIKNVKERMDAYFGPPYGIAISSEAGLGTTVTITIPRMENKMIGGKAHVEDRTGG